MIIGEDVAHKRAERCRRLWAKCGCIDCPCGEEPGDQDSDQKQPEDHDRGKPRRSHDTQSVHPADAPACLASPAHLIEADRGRGADEREPRGEREQERQEVIPERPRGEQEANQRIDQRDQDHIRSERGNIVDPRPDCRPEVRDRQAPDHRHRRGAAVGNQARRLAHGMAARRELIRRPLDRISDVLFCQA